MPDFAPSVISNDPCCVDDHGLRARIATVYAAPTTSTFVTARPHGGAVIYTRHGATCSVTCPHYIVDQ